MGRERYPLPTDHKLLCRVPLQVKRGRRWRGFPVAGEARARVRVFVHPGGLQGKEGGPAVASPGAGAQAGGMAASTELRFLGYVVIAREVRARSVSRNAAVGGLCCVAPEMSGLGKGLECRTSLSLEETRNPKSIKE